MDIAFLEPLGRAWNRMKTALFKPFDLHKWFVVGFNAFLAGLLEMHNGSGGSQWREDSSFREFLGLPNRTWEWLMDDPGWFFAIITIAAFVIVLVITLIWLSARGTFMFLDNVVHDSAEIAKPWNRYKKEGNSLFLWRLVFGLICLMLFIMFFVFFFVAAPHIYDSSYSHRAPVEFLIPMGLLFLLMSIIIGYISLFLKSFVVPIMYKNNIKTTQAWSRFLPIFTRHPFHFILYGLLMFVMTIMFVIFIIFAGFATCCIGFVLLIIPVVGTVVTLPVWYTFRAFSLDFLAQFGPEFDAFPPSEDSPTKVTVKP